MRRSKEVQATELSRSSQQAVHVFSVVAEAGTGEDGRAANTGA